MMHTCQHARASVEVLGGGRRDLYKAVKRGKLRSVDWALNRSSARRLERRLAPLFAEWRARAARRLAEAYAGAVKADQDLVESILASLDAEQFSVDIVDELTPALRRTFRDAGISAVQEIGFDASNAIVSHVDEAAVTYASQHGADLVTRITETLRADLREMISGAVDDGLSSQDLAGQIGEAFGFSDARSIMIARTELAFAHTQGNVAGWRASGVVERKRWVVAQDNVCPACEAMDGEEADLDGSFRSADFGDVDSPPLHPNCRCDVVAVLSEQEEAA